jgi:hypothetical protein
VVFSSLAWFLAASSWLAASPYDCVGAMHARASREFIEALQAAPMAPRFTAVPRGVPLTEFGAPERTADGRRWSDLRGRHVYDAERGINEAFVGAERPCRTAVHERAHQVFVLLAFTPGWRSAFAKIDHARAAAMFPSSEPGSFDAYCRDPKRPQEYFACASEVWCGVYPGYGRERVPAELASVMRRVYGDCAMPGFSEAR